MSSVHPKLRLAGPSPDAPCVGFCEQAKLFIAACRYQVHTTSPDCCQIVLAGGQAPFHFVCSVMFTF